MTVALRSKRRISALIAVDNAPIKATLKSDFAKYIQGMRKIEQAHVTKHLEADKILAEFERVRVREFACFRAQRLIID